MVFEDVVEKMKFFNFRNLLEKVESLEYIILIWFDKVIVFKYYIYLEGVSDYFIREYFGVFVNFFLLEILWLCIFLSVLICVWNEMKKCLIIEI